MDGGLLYWKRATAQLFGYLNANWLEMPPIADRHQEVGNNDTL